MPPFHTSCFACGSWAQLVACLHVHHARGAQSSCDGARSALHPPQPDPPQPGPRAEEYNPRLPFVHALWHILSASSVATVNGLVEDVENEQLQKRLEMRPLGL